MKWKSPSLGDQDLGSGPTAPQITLCTLGGGIVLPSHPSCPYTQVVVEKLNTQRGHATCPMSHSKAGHHPPCLVSGEGCALSCPDLHEQQIQTPSPHHRQTCPCCSGNSYTAPAWPSSPLPSTWPSTSSSCWMPMPLPPLIPQSSCSKSMRTARGGHLTGTLGAFCGWGGRQWRDQT